MEANTLENPFLQRLEYGVFAAKFPIFRVRTRSSMPGPASARAGATTAEFVGLHIHTKPSYFYLNLCRKLALVSTDGSDFRGRIKPQVAFGSVRDMGPELIAVLESRRPRSAQPLES